MKAIQVAAPGAEFELVQKEIPEPRESEVRIKVEVCGICHGDAVVKEGRFPGISYPRVPGHEVVGKIDKLGSKVTGWETGQRVGVGWYGGPCLKCADCKRGDLSNCESFLTTGISFDGGYAEYMTVPMQGLAAIPDELVSVEAAPLLCAGRTTFTALRTSGAQGGDLVAVHGLGGLGHLAVQFASKLGYRTVAISRGKDKKALAYQLGAHTYIDAEATDAAVELKKTRRGPHHPGDRSQQQSDFRADQWALPGRPVDYCGLVKRADANFTLAAVGWKTLGERLDRPARQEFLRGHAQIQRGIWHCADGRSFSAGTGPPGF
jgi:D-arabinose 1-dehydrogenase-like Zn-dependent alcohol dehydrogenase